MAKKSEGRKGFPSYAEARKIVQMHGRFSRDKTGWVGWSDFLILSGKKSNFPSYEEARKLVKK